ncbi:hypothetical protein UACE39S_06906 [Ureibacillus acetophenoni]
MNQIIELKIKPNFVSEIANGYPLILKECGRTTGRNVSRRNIVKNCPS